MKRSRIALIVVAALLVVVAVGGGIARQQFLASSNPIEPFGSNSPTAVKKVYVAMDKSEWKLAAVHKLVDSLKDKVNFTVENLPTLAKLNSAEWDAIVIVAPVYAGALQSDAANFAAHSDAKSKILLLTTSGSVKIALDGVDVLAAASSDADDTITAVGEKLNKLLGL